MIRSNSVPDDADSFESSSFELVRERDARCDAGAFADRAGESIVSGTGAESVPGRLRGTPESESKATGEAPLYDRNFLLTFISQTCFVVANTLLAHYARWIEFLGGDLTEIGWVMGLGAAAGLVLRPTLAQCINIFGAKTTWAAGYIVFSMAAIANLLLVDVGPLLYILRAANVLGAALVFASSLTYISQIAPEHRRTEAIGTLGVGGFVGMFLGPLLGDLFLGVGTRARGDFEFLFVVAAVANVVPLVLLTFLRSPPKRSQPQSFGLSEFFRVSIRYWPGRIILVDLIFGVCMTVPFVFLASYIDEAPIQLAGVSEIGYFFWCYAGCGMLFRLGLRKLPERIGAEKVLCMGLATMAIGVGSFLLVGPNSPWLLAVPAALIGLGHGLTFHTMTSLTIAPFPIEFRGTASALALMMLDLGTLIGAPALGMIGEQFGYDGMFAVLGLLCLLSAAIMFGPAYAVKASGPQRVEGEVVK
ncbi:MAG: MFS transporter [Planctomycetota bacterium]